MAEGKYTSSMKQRIGIMLSLLIVFTSRFFLNLWFVFMEDVGLYGNNIVGIVILLLGFLIFAYFTLNKDIPSISRIAVIVISVIYTIYCVNIGFELYGSFSIISDEYLRTILDCALLISIAFFVCNLRIWKSVQIGVIVAYLPPVIFDFFDFLFIKFESYKTYEALITATEVCEVASPILDVVALILVIAWMKNKKLNIKVHSKSTTVANDKNLKEPAVPNDITSENILIANRMDKPKKRCPFCGEEILAVAKKCKHCGEWLEAK